MPLTCVCVSAVCTACRLVGRSVFFYATLVFAIYMLSSVCVCVSVCVCLCRLIAHGSSVDQKIAILPKKKIKKVMQKMASNEHKLNESLAGKKSCMQVRAKNK